MVKGREEEDERKRTRGGEREEESERRRTRGGE
jgi:hypothetical protein